MPEPKKSQVILFTRSPGFNKYSMNLTLLGHQVPQAREVKLLGITLDPWLSWKPYVDEMIKKAYPRIVMVKKLAKIMGAENPRIVYNTLDAFVLSIFFYGAPVIYAMADSQWMRIEQFQMLALKMINEVPTYASGEMILRETRQIGVKQRMQEMAA